MGSPNLVLTCSGCGSRFDGRAWASLVLVERIEPAEIGRVLLDWPDEFCIEVRCCRRCKKELAAKCDAAVPAKFAV